MKFEVLYTKGQHTNRPLLHACTSTWDGFCRVAEWLADEFNDRNSISSALTESI